MPGTSVDSQICNLAVGHGRIQMIRYLERAFSHEPDPLWTVIGATIGFVVASDPAILLVGDHDHGCHDGADRCVRVADVIHRWLSSLSSAQRHRLNPDMLRYQPSDQRPGWLIMTSTHGRHPALYFLPEWY